MELSYIPCASSIVSVLGEGGGGGGGGYYMED